MSLRALTVLAVLSLLAAGSAPAQEAARISSAAVEPAVSVTITPTGFAPEEVEVVPGQTVHWTNESGGEQSVTAQSGLFDSGPIPPGGGFSMTLDVAATHAYSSSGDPDFAGSVQVVLVELPGPAGALAEDNVPDIPFPPRDEADLGRHPTLGFTASRTRILVSFAPGATLAQANTALGEAGVDIIGGIADFGVLLVEAPDSADFSAVTTAVESLEASPAVEVASLVPQMEVEVVPQAAENAVATFANAPWVWRAAFDTAVGSPPRTPLGDGGNWGIEGARFPQAWNFIEPIKRKSNPVVDTAIIDAGFDTHNDLTALTLPTLCKTFLGISWDCIPQVVNDHGTHIAGTIGADFDNSDGAEANRSNGVSGANPFAAMSGVFWGFSENGGGFEEIFEIYDLLFDATEDGTIPNLRVISFSVGTGIPADDPADSCNDDDDGDGAPCAGVNTGGAANTCNLASTTIFFVAGTTSIDCNGGEVNDSMDWWNYYPQANCGPGMNDDGAGAQWCTVNNEDTVLERAARLGKLARTVAERASDLNIAIVQAAGNESNDFCTPATTPPPGCALVPIVAANMAPFAWAADNWLPGRPNPIFVVEAIGTSGLPQARARANFSNVRSAALSPDGLKSYVSAPGVSILSTIPANGYGRMNGTSMATPHVSALAGYLLAYNPALTVQQVRDTISTWTRSDTSGGASPRMDAFAAMLSLQGAAKELVDVNDQSKDGNRRVILGPGGAPQGPDTQFAASGAFRTDPDGKVSMRDFRRFRDAWLQVCAAGAGGGCPAAADVVLNGDANHVKKDLNWDRCVNPADAHCPTPEREFPRFDFNGDGEIQFDQDAAGNSAQAVVPLKADGSPAAAPGEATSMTDLDVLQSQWDGSPANTEGYSAADLDTLMPSGDLEIHAQDFFDAGATEVDVAVSKAGGSLPDRTLAQGDDFLVYTVPTEEVTVRASADVGGELLESAPLKVTLKPGEDRRLDLCVLHVELSASRDRLPANGTATATVVAELKGCPGDDVANKLMTFALEPTGLGHATLNPTGGTTDADGKLTTTFTAGTEQTAYTLTATAELGAGKQAKGKIEITTLPVLTISYVWEQKTVSWSESGNTRWGAIAGMPDCTTAGVAYCIDTFTIGPHPTLPSSGLKRQGTLSGSESSFFLSEEVINSLNRSQSSWTLSNPDGSNVRSATESAEWGVLESDAERYQNHGLPTTVQVEDRPEAVRLLGLKAVGELGYRHSLVSGKTGDAEDPIELHSTRGEFLLAPRGDGSALRFAVDLSRPLEFKRQLDGTLKPYSFCGTFTKDLTTQPGYRVAQGSEWVSGAVDLTRKTTFAPGDRPMPVGPGAVTLRYAFAATTAYGATAPTPTLPDCSVNNPPDADFEYTPAAPKEGRVVRFFDRSTDPENNISKWNWTFGDGQTSNVQDPHLLYHDDADYPVGLRVEDTEGAANGPETKLVSVANEPPEVGIDDATGQVGTAITTSFRLWDPARADQASIGYELKRTDTGAVLFSFNDPAGRYTLTFPAGFFSSAGSYPFTLTATDKDGASASDTATITVTQDPPPPEEEPGPPTPTCDPTVTLDEQEQAFVQEVNDYRAENGLDPVVASPALTRASERHVDDMVATDFIGHDGSDGSTPAERASDAGYPSQSTGENLAFDFETAVDVLLGWKSSQTGHNENMLNPNWKAVGIARKEGPTTMPPEAPHDAWWWATLYGDVVDCPAPSSLASTTSLSTGSRTATASAGGAGVQAAEIEPDEGVESPPPLEGEPPEEIRIEAAPSSLSARSFAAVVTEPALAAFTVSDVTPEADVPVTLTNVSRDVAGDPIGGMLDIGNGPEAIAADGVADITFPPGTFDITLSVPKPGGGELAVTRSLTATAPPLPELSIQNATTTEGGDAVFDVMLSAASAQTVSVGFSTEDDSATAPSDYTAANGTVSFQPGQTEKTITIDVVDDALDEPGETFFVNLDAPTNATLANEQALGTIIDNDLAPTVSVNDATATEGETARFDVALSGPSGKLVTVGFSTSTPPAGDTATENVDYTPRSNTLVFLPGQVSKPVDVSTTEDAIDERDEHFTLGLGTLTNVTPGDVQGDGMIDDDDGPVVSIAGPLFPVAEGNSGTTAAAFTVSLSEVSPQVVSVTYATGDVTAVAPQDYAAVAAGQLVIPADQIEGTIVIPVVGDTADDADQETFVVNLTGVTDASIGVGTAAATILDDDLPPPPPPPAPQGPPPDTTAPVMRIATAPVTASKTGAVRVRLTCPPDESLCTGLLTLRSKSRLNVRGALEARLAQVTFGRKAFTLQGGQTAPVTVKLSRKNRALLARLKKVRVLAIVEARDAAGNLQRTQATFLLRAPKRR